MEKIIVEDLLLLYMAWNTRTIIVCNKEENTLSCDDAIQLYGEREVVGFKNYKSKLLINI